MRIPSLAGLKLSRRRILAAGGGAIAAMAMTTRSTGQAPAVGSTAADGLRILRARHARVALRGADADALEVPGYDGTVPGPLLRVRRGEEMAVRLINELTVATAVHWHGVRLPNAMDGVPGLTQPPIAPGASFDYRFVPPDAGTFWYHPPVSGGAEPSGLAGVLIVEEAQAVDVDHDVALLLQDWSPVRDGNAGMMLTANGTAPVDIALRANDRLRLRLVNATVARALPVRIDRHRAQIMAVDGEPAEPFAPRAGRLVLGPGNRVDLFIDANLGDAILGPGERAPLVIEHADGDTVLARLVYDAAPPTRARPRPDPAPLPANPLPERIDLAHALKLEVKLDAVPRAAAGQGPPLFSVPRGRPVMLALTNRGAVAQSVHIHGHHVRLLDRLDDGWKPFWLDTLLVPAAQTERIAFVADNPGKWRLAAAREPGLSTWFEVT